MEERLQKLIAMAGIASRRRAEEMILIGEVVVNGQTIRSLGAKADPSRDHIKVRGKLINPLIESRENIYVVLNKPRGYISTLDDPQGRPLVRELLPASLGRLHPVGRLDFNSEGLLLMTNDGHFTNHVTSPSNNIQKVYEVKVKGNPSQVSLERLRRGIVLDDGIRTAPARIEKIRDTGVNSWFEVILHEGRNQQIRRMFDATGHSILKLRRIQIGSVRDERLTPGKWRFLTPSELRGFLRKPNRESARRLKHKTAAAQRQKHA